MKHKLSITIMLLAMFLLTQAVGLFVVNAYTPQKTIDHTTGKEITLPNNDLPFGLQASEEEQPTFYHLLIAFALAFALIFILIKYKWKSIIRAWFFFVVVLALGLTIYAVLKSTPLANAAVVSIVIAIPLAFLKIFNPNPYAHNITELLIYPGISAVFVPILTPASAIILLVIISIYDAWAVWKSGIMQKMAQFQMEELKIFGGFLIPSSSKKVKQEISKIKQKYKNKKIPEKIRKKKFKVNLAILGGGDVVFPIITAGVFLRAFGLIPALFVTFGAFAGLTYLFFITQKGKAYPAMPYITSGVILGIVLWSLTTLL